MVAVNNNNNNDRFGQREKRAMDGSWQRKWSLRMAVRNTSHIRYGTVILQAQALRRHRR